jgi:hypothetical protein
MAVNTIGFKLVLFLLCGYSSECEFERKMRHESSILPRPIIIILAKILFRTERNRPRWLVQFLVTKSPFGSKSEHNFMYE